jgi:hypothetical protein
MPRLVAAGLWHLAGRRRLTTAVVVPIPLWGCDAGAAHLEVGSFDIRGMIMTMQSEARDSGALLMEAVDEQWELMPATRWTEDALEEELRLRNAKRRARDEDEEEKEEEEEEETSGQEKEEADEEEESFEEEEEEDEDFDDLDEEDEFDEEDEDEDAQSASV